MNGSTWGDTWGDCWGGSWGGDEAAPIIRAGGAHPAQERMRRLRDDDDAVMLLFVQAFSALQSYD